jgi:hypothetical protein
MTPANSPVVLAVAAPDRSFADDLLPRLAQRGMEVVLLMDDVASLQPNVIAGLIASSAAVLIVLSPAGLSAGLVQACDQQATVMAKPVVPLLVQTMAALPADLSETQWVDFRYGLESGMRDLLLTLDLLHLLPTSSAWLDWELALSRAYAGFAPPNWTIFRRYARGTTEVAAN